MYSKAIVQPLNRAGSSSRMSCLEHQRLTQADFAHAADFEYLIKHELPCFSIEVRRGQLSLLVGHYLSKIILPSGLSLEILPKITSAQSDIRVASNQTDSFHKDIVRAREWVAAMLQDIAHDKLGKAIPAINLAAIESFSDSAVNNDWSHFSALALSFPESQPQLNQKNQQPKSSLDAPWYQGLLVRISEVLQQAAGILPNRYQTQVNNRPKAQGKINLSAQLKNNWHRPHYLYTEHSVFASDELLAQFLSTAWQCWQQLSQNSPIPTNRQTPESLRGIQTLPPSQWAVTYHKIQNDKSAWMSQFTTMQAQTITDAIEWSWWLLTHSNINSAPHDQVRENWQVEGLPMPALMINMNHAFERWVLGKLYNWVSDNLVSSRLVIQPKFDWLHQKLPSSNPLATSSKQTGEKSSVSIKDTTQHRVIQKLIPDACIVTAEGKISHVIDIKYKTIEGIAQVSGADWQQLYVYQQHLQCENAWLIYPMTKKFTERLDVLADFNENRQSNQGGTAQMSAIPFNLYRGLLLI